MIETIEQAQAFLNECLSKYGWGFHPDDPAEAYGLQDLEAEAFDTNMDRTFEEFADADLDVYSYCMEYLKETQPLR